MCVVSSFQSHMEEMSRVSSRRKVFNEQANRLMDETSSLQDEVSWRVTHLNSKWEQIENSLSTNGCSRCEKETCPGNVRIAKFFSQYDNIFKNDKTPFLI